MAKKPVLTPEQAKSNALETALTTIERKFGKGSVMRLKDQAIEKIPVIPTGSLGLDLALGVGGIPRGRVTEIFGPESSGKTTLTLHIIAECQKRGGTCAFIDAEHALDVTYAKALGVNTDELLVSQPDYGEQALQIADMLVRSAAVELVVIDSVAALVPQAELNGDLGSMQVGSQARLMSHAMRRLTGTIHRSNTAVIFINQIRMKIGSGPYMGSPETTTGGNALKFYSSVRIDIRRTATLKDSKENAIGNQTKAKVVKNKVAPPFRTANFDIMYGRGISRAGELIELGVAGNIIDKSGSWFAYKGEKLGQGKERIRELLEEDDELRAQVENDVRAFLGMPSIEEAEESAMAPMGEPQPLEVEPRNSLVDNAFGAVEGSQAFDGEDDDNNFGNE
ncbi:recombinase RecA [Desulfovibrio sp. An276]|nr:recombinase RecA [Desulfovibrio sp. An276]